jgi:hypothetical protein
MEEWSHNYRTEIDTIFFKQKTLKDVINLRFNPGEGIAQYQMAKRGITILVCHPRGIEETEPLSDHEHATRRKKSTRTLQEASNLTTSTSEEPIVDLASFILTIDTFSACVVTI